MPEARQRRITPRGQRKRQRIIDEATRVFARDGYRSGSMAELANAAGLTLQGVLHYFPTKPQLLLAVINQRDESRETALSAQSPLEGIDRFFESLRHNAAQPHLIDLMSILAAESTQPNHPTHDWFVNLYVDQVHRLTELIRAEQLSGDFLAPVDPELAARLLIGAADGLRLQLVFSPSHLNRVQLLEELFRWLRRGELL